MASDGTPTLLFAFCRGVWAGLSKPNGRLRNPNRSIFSWSGPGKKLGVIMA